MMCLGVCRVMRVMYDVSWRLYNSESNVLCVLRMLSSESNVLCVLASV